MSLMKPKRPRWMRVAVVVTAMLLVTGASLQAQEGESSNQAVTAPEKAGQAGALGDESAIADAVASLPDDPSGEPAEPSEIAEIKELPWDYRPYRVLVWVVSSNPQYNAAGIDQELRQYLDRHFSAIWRMDIKDAPLSVRSIANRDMKSFSFDTLSASDPVIAVKKDHPESVRIRVAANVATLIKTVAATKGRIADAKRRGADLGDETLEGVADRLQAIDGDERDVAGLWSDPDVEAVMLSRGMAIGLDEPEAKLLTPAVSGLVSDAVENYDKIFVVHVDDQVVPHRVQAIEMDTLMHHFGPVAVEESTDRYGLIPAVGRALTRAFAPVVRIEDAGQRNAVGLLRAGGLILSEDSPGYVGLHDVLEPMVRKNDRNGRPILIGPIDWAYLYVYELDEDKLKMDFHAGRPGGLQGRKNNRTFRMALKVRPFGEETLVRLHAKGNPDFPLIGYEIYQRELESKHMDFIGRTDWNGRIWVKRTDDPLRLFYVKNGGAVLARLPTVPGLTELEIADISGDDMRLQAEAYIRGVQNSIIDLVAIRELYKARIMLRLKKGEIKRAEELFATLKDRPTNEKLANEMGKKQDFFVKAIGRNPNQVRKVDEMFKTTRDLLQKHINPTLVNELEQEMIKARASGGKLPADE